MKTSSHQNPLSRITSALAAMVVITTSGFAAPDLSELKLQGRWPAGINPTGFYQGDAVALSEKWALSAAAFSAPGGIAGEGAVHVFSATSGAWVRMLRPPAPPLANTRFGSSLAVSGDFALIGADGEAADRGAVHIYNLATGAFVRTLRASDGSAGNLFGWSIAASGQQVLIGAYGDDSEYGSAYLFDWTTGVEQFHFYPSDAAVSQKRFGHSVAIEGNIALIGAPNRAGRGAAYLFDLTTHAELSIIDPPGAAAGDNVGYGVALSQGIAIMSAPYHAVDQGAVFTHDVRSGLLHMISPGVTNELFGYGVSGVAASNGMLLVGSSYGSGGTGMARLYDLRTGVAIRPVLPSDFGTGGYYGSAVAMSGNNAMIGSAQNDAPLTNIGAAYLFKPLTTALPLTKVAAGADSAPGVSETTFSVLNDAFINADGEVAFTAKLTGAASHASTDVGLWTSLQAASTLSVTAATNRSIGFAGQVLTLGTPTINQAAFTLYPVSFKPGIGGVTAATSKALFLSSPTTTLFFTSGVATQPFGVSQVASFIEPVQTFTTSFNRFAVTCALKLDASTNAGSDSGFFLYDAGSGISDGRREGVQVQPSNTFNSITYGQFSGRISYLRNSVAYNAAIAGPVADNAVLMQKAYNVTETLVAQKGVLAAGAGAAKFSAFIGETTSPNEDVLYRATLSGAPAASNEGLWSSTSSTSTLLLRKGTPSALLLAGLSVAKFINYWSVGQASPITLALVQLTGPGVSVANDQAIILLQENGSSNILMREGQAAPGCHPATIGVISRIDVDPWLGTYAIVATLASAPVGTELALFTGVASNVGNATTLTALRRPVLYLRKGQLYDNQPSKIKSFSLPTTNLTAGGAGGTGRGRAISWSGRFAITVEFDNGVRQLMKGQL